MFFILAALLFSISARSQTPEEGIGLRLIAVRTEAEAASLRQQLESGQSFEVMAKAHSVDASAKDGGFLGTFHLTDLKPDLQRAVMGLAPGQISPVTRIGGEFLILQRLSLEEVRWMASYNAGLEAFQGGRYDQAAQRFLAALPDAEKLTPVDYRLEDNLHGLAEAYRLQQKYAEAEPYYRRYLGVHWGGPTASETLDRFSALLALAYFEDAQFDEARKRLYEALDHASFAEGFYGAMSVILFKAQLMDEAEALMERAAQVFPASKDVQYRLAELYRSNFKTRKALEVFQRISRMEAPAGLDAAVDRLQQSAVYQKIGSLHAELAELDPAAAAYTKALEFTPDSVDERFGLGDVFLQQGRVDAALAEYNRALATDPKRAAVHYRIADANLRMGRFAEAVASARTVLTLDPGHRKAHYVLATALVRMGAQDEGDKELETYRKLEAEARAQADGIRSELVANREAASKLLEGRGEDAIEHFQKIIEAYPGSVTAYLNLGTAQIKLGRREAAVETFQNMLTRNITDSFLVSWRLAQEYRQLGDMEASRRHEAVYFQNVDLALRQALESSLE